MAAVTLHARQDGGAAGPPPLTPEQLAALPHDDAGPRLNVVIWVLTILSGIFLCLRLYCKRMRGKGLWWDDWLLTAAWVMILAETCLISVSISLGYGHHTWDIPPSDISGGFKIFSVAALFSIIASIWSKSSFGLTILRLSEGWLRRVIWFLIISTNVLMGLTALFNYVHCSPIQKSWDLIAEGTCWPPDVLLKYNTFSAAWSGVMDISLALIPWKLIGGLQMERTEKIGVIVAMSMGVFAGITAFVKTSKLWVMGSTDLYDSVELNIWTNAEITVTIIAASIPILRALVKEATSAYRGSGASGSGKANTLAPGGTSASKKTVSRTTGRGKGGDLDTRSDKSMLENDLGEELMITNEVADVYSSRDVRPHTRSKDVPDSYEMELVG